MDTKNSEIRNSNGSLICDCVYDEGVWTVTVKRKGVYTFISLHGDGSIHVENICGSSSISEAEYAFSLPT